VHASCAKTWWRCKLLVLVLVLMVVVELLVLLLLLLRDTCSCPRPSSSMLFRGKHLRTHQDLIQIQPLIPLRSHPWPQRWR